VTRVVFILGCTAGGKSAVAREIARRTGGQIVSVDSMKVYRRMDIGTAKPSPADRAEVPHHCIDVVEPAEDFSVARYLEHADRAIAAIAASGGVVLAVGGTALYVKALSEGLFAGPGADPAVRRHLDARAAAEGLGALHADLARVDPEAARRIHPNDRKRIVRALEVYELAGEPISALQKQWDVQRRRYDGVFIGLRRDKDDASRRINARVKRMIAAGLADEVAGLLSEPGWAAAPAAAALGYAEMVRHLRGEIGLDDAAEQIKINTRRFAKHQRTWFRQFRATRWIDVAPDATVEAVADAAMAYVAGGG